MDEAAGDQPWDPGIADLRGRAEQMLPRAQDLDTLSEADVKGLFHELQVHQVELEMQNEELRRAQLELQLAAERYASLYDFAPVGYLTLDEGGVIVETNLRLAHQLGLVRHELLSRPLTAFVHRDDQSEFFLFRRRLLPAKDVASCEIRLQAADGMIFWAHLEGRPWPAIEDWRGWRITVSDVTERRSATEFLKQLTEELERRVHERTERLDATNRLLRAEITQRKQVEDLLRDRERLLEERVAERTRSLESLLTISHNVVSTLELQQVVTLILEHLQYAVEYSGCVVYVLEDGMLRVLDYRGPLARDEALRIRIPLAVTAGLRDVVERKRPLLIDDLAAGSPEAAEWRSQAVPAQLALLGQARSYLAVPLIAKDHAIGVLRLDHNDPGYFTERQAQLVLTIANQTAIAIENARLYGQAQHLAALEERQRLARDLHDSVAQTFYSIALSAHVLRDSHGATQDPKIGALAERVLTLCKAGLAEIRAVVSALRSEAVEKEGLVGGLAHLIAALRTRDDVAIEAILGDEPDTPIEAKEALYRIAQEGLRNVMRHASARHASVRLTQSNDHLLLEIADDGVGFDPETDYPGLGLRSMQKRVDGLGGTLEVDSRPGSGTRIRVRMPLQP